MVQRVSSIDSLDQNESNTENLRFVSGCRKWINTNDNNRVENSFVFNKYEDSIEQKSLLSNKYQFEDEEDLSNSSRMDLSLQHFDVQLQVADGQLQQATRYGVFSSLLSNDRNTFKTNQSSQTVEPEMDMDSGHGQRNGYSRQQYNGNNNDNSYRRNRQTNGSSGSNGGDNGSPDGNGSNPNRNNNNSRR
jgi:hypothetical protein